ncbi:MAG: ABC transporter ATP-binding protein [Candidatus Competibacteraceae bacterium]|nr:ABC transporter ATP-binding protein [Candidatus Competibacteraceae bacterium]
MNTSALAIHNLRKVYANGLEALRGIDLDIAEGEFFALLGPNGAGKSTAIGIICSLVRKTAGTVRVFGHDIDTDLTAAKRCIGLVPQEFNFNQFEPVAEIVVNQAGYYGIPRPLAHLRAETYLRQLGLWDKRREMARQLSGGMKRRLMIARALVHEPKLLILDEPTAGVDIEIRRSMWEFLRGINARGTTIILTTHYLEEAESLCRQVAIIDRGLIAQNGPMSALLGQLHLETFVLNLGQALTDPPEVAGYAVRRVDAYTLEADVSKDRGLNELFRQLSARGITVLSLRNKVNRLEELFVRLVDKSDSAARTAAETV